MGRKENAPQALSDKVAGWLENWFAENGRDTAVLALSRDRDSAVTAALCAKALGPGHVHALLLPNGDPEAYEEARQLAQSLGISGYLADIQAACLGLYGALSGAMGRTPAPGAAAQTPDRIRMAALYAAAQTLAEAEGLHPCVVSSENRTEAELGIGVLWGGAFCDVAPLRDLWVDEVDRMGAELGLFPEHAGRPDGSGRLPGEAQLGVSYLDIRAYRMEPDRMEPEARQRVARLVEAARPAPVPPPSYVREDPDLARMLGRMENSPILGPLWEYLEGLERPLGQELLRLSGLDPEYVHSRTFIIKLTYMARDCAWYLDTGDGRKPIDADTGRSMFACIRNDFLARHQARQPKPRAKRSRKPKAST